MILLRHGETVFNVLFGKTRRDPGVRDPRLTERGREQAEQAAQTLAEKSITRVIASPYTRAIQTAHVVAQRIGVSVEIETAIRERYSYACDIGTPRRVLAVRWPDYTFDHIDETWWPDREEPESQFEARCREFRRRMAETSDWHTTAVVTHWGVVRALTGEQIKNCEMRYHDPTSERTADATLVPGHGTG